MKSSESSGQRPYPMPFNIGLISSLAIVADEALGIAATNFLALTVLL